MDSAKSELQRTDLTPEETGRALIRMARAHSALGQEKEAVAIWKSLAADESADSVSRTRATFRLAHWNEESGQWNQAIIHYKDFALLFASLVPEDRASFDGNTENPSSLLFHIGEIQEHEMLNPEEARKSYVNALRYAEDMNSLNLQRLRRLYGEFLLRQGLYEDALVEYEKAAYYEETSDVPPSTTSIIARIGMVECLCLLGRCEEAQLALQPLSSRWADTEYEARTGYVKQGKELLRRHCPE